MYISSVRSNLPCRKSQEEETFSSLITRITGIGIGLITLLVGVLILCEIPGASTLGPTAGKIFCSVGGVTILLSLSLRCVKDTPALETHSSQSIQEPDLSIKDPLVNLSSSQANNQESLPPKPKEAQKNQHILKNSFSIRDEENTKGLSVDFSKITPENYEEYLDLEPTITKKGYLFFKKHVFSTDYDSPITGLSYRQGDHYLMGQLQHDKRGWCGMGHLYISKGEFIHFPQLTAPQKRFSNLKDFFDYLFRGEFYQGDYFAGMKFFILKMRDGQEVRYYNPYNLTTFVL